VLKQKRVARSSESAQWPYLGTQADVDDFLNNLRMELEQAIANEERMEIR
jgi:hypothetical protein